MGSVTFYSGITIRGGLTLPATDSGGGGDSIPTPNSIVVATVTTEGSYTYYGAISLTGAYYQVPIGDFGTITSEPIYALYYETNGIGPYYTNRTNILMRGGNYTGFSVLNGRIDSDQASYPKIFTIDGTNYTFKYNGDGVYSLPDDPASLGTKIGDTVTLVYDPAIQISLTPNTMIVDSYVQSSTTYYGASKISNPIYGTIVSDYFQSVEYDGSSTIIYLANGTYTGFSVTGGCIDSDVSGSTRIFTIGGVDATLTASGGGNNLNYVVYGNPFNLQSSVGQTITIEYDPAAQGGGGAGELVSGTITVGNQYGVYYGWQSGQFGDSTLSMMGPVIGIKYDASFQRTEILFLTGTYGTVVITNTTVDDETSVTVVIDGITETLEMDPNGYGVARIAGDVFSLQSKFGQTLNVSVTPGVPPAEFVPGTTYTYSTDYNYGGMSINGTTSEYQIRISSFSWYQSAGYDALVALTTGDQFQVYSYLDPGPDSGNSLITLTSSFTNQGPYYQATATASVALQSYGVTPQKITLDGGGGGGGGGGTTYTSSGNWMSSNFYLSGPSWQVNLYLSNANAGLVSALNALTMGSSISLSDGINNVTVTVDSLSGLPYNNNSYVAIYVSSPPPGTPSMPGISSITL